MLTSSQILNIPAHRHKVRPIGIAAFPGVEVLDITGPLEVFAFANFGLQQQGLSAEIAYPIKVIAEKPGPITTMSGLQIVAHDKFSEISGSIDTLLIPGSDALESLLKDSVLLDWICVMAPRVRRLASICSGAFLLAESGLLDGRHATTHWHYCDRLARDYPAITVEPNKIFIRDDFISTSGGITSGIDLALAMVEEDWGHELALFVARYLVVYLKRPGGQSQFSAYLTNEAVDRNDLRSLQTWIMEHPREDLRVNALAERMSMSPRNFARIFLAETGTTTAKYVEMVRIDAARHYLTHSSLPIKSVTEKSGFRDAETMRRAFIRNLGVNPQSYRARFTGSSFSPTPLNNHAATSVTAKKASKKRM